MMKTILLLAFAVLVFSSPAQSSHPTVSKHTYKLLLKGLIEELGTAMKNFSKDAEETPSIFLTKLNGCEPETFCQAEQELRNKVSGLFGTIYDPFRTDKKLIRNLNSYNTHHGKTCEPAAEGQDQVHLHAFLKNLLTCVKSEFSQLK